MPTSRSTTRIELVLLAAALGIVCRPCLLRAAAPAGEMIELTVKGRKIEGVPIRWNDHVVHLLGRDGRLWEFDPEEARDYKKTSARFCSYSPSEFRSVLLRELGDGYDVSGTGHYLVAHPKGQSDKWSQRFEDLYRSFAHYFSVRGFEPLTPPFPLVGVVCRNQAEFVRRASAQGGPTANGVLGYYNVGSNRINLYDMGDKAGAANWQKNASVLIHEATHQMAFNTGVHSRYSLPPTWLVEGLAMMFEAPGVYDAHNHARPSERVNRDRLAVFRRSVAPRHRPETLSSIVASDDLFSANPGVAYAEAWALSFFLAETEPRKYAEYLKRTASRPPFQDYTATERLADFTAIFGTDWRMLEARFLRFMGEVK